MRTSICLLSMLFAACGGAQKGGSYSPGAGADVRCFEGTRDLETAEYPMTLKLIFDPANKKVVEIFTDRDHDQNGYKPYDATEIYAVGADGSATGKGEASAKFTTGDAWKWTGWTTHEVVRPKDMVMTTERTATLEGDKLTYAETATLDISGIGPSTTTSKDTFTKIDCAQYEAKRQALGRSTKKAK